MYILFEILEYSKIVLGVYDTLEEAKQCEKKYSNLLLNDGYGYDDLLIVKFKKNTLYDKGGIYHEEYYKKC